MSLCGCTEIRFVNIGAATPLNFQQILPGGAVSRRTRSLHDPELPGVWPFYDDFKGTLFCVLLYK